jgi:nicotinamidase-related amidase
MNTIPANTALLVIDVQEGFDDPKWGRRNNDPGAENNIARLLAAWRRASMPVYHVAHLSLIPGSPFTRDASGVRIKAVAAPLESEPVIYKTVNCAFIGTDLEQRLRERNIRHLVITGLTTDHCVSTTTRMAGNLGFDVLCVGDGTATFERRGPNGQHYSAEEMHNVNLASLDAEFATVVTTADIIGAMPQTPVA